MLFQPFLQKFFLLDFEIKELSKSLNSFIYVVSLMNTYSNHSIFKIDVYLKQQLCWRLDRSFLRWRLAKLRVGKSRIISLRNLNFCFGCVLLRSRLWRFRLGLLAYFHWLLSVMNYLTFSRRNSWPTVNDSLLSIEFIITVRKSLIGWCLIMLLLRSLKSLIVRSIIFESLVWRFGSFSIEWRMRLKVLLIAYRNFRFSDNSCLISVESVSSLVVSIWRKCSIQISLVHEIGIWRVSTPPRHARTRYSKRKLLFLRKLSTVLCHFLIMSCLNLNFVFFSLLHSSNNVLFLHFR